MKKTEHGTEYILLKAYTESEWDFCSFAIIHITEEWKKTLTGRLEALVAFKDDGNFCHLSYWGAPTGFYKDPDDEAQRAEAILGQEDDWCFIELEETVPDNLPTPENKLGAHQLIIGKYGSALYKAYGKHTGEEFYTAEFGIGDLLAKINV